MAVLRNKAGGPNSNPIDDDESRIAGIFYAGKGRMHSGTRCGALNPIGKTIEEYGYID